MFLKELNLDNYRNYSELSFKFKSGTTVLTGKNAQGKTNILEAIFLCCTGRSHRTAKEKELISWDEHNAAVKSSVEKVSGLYTVEILLSTTERKKIKINGMPIQRLGELMGNINSVMFSYDELKLIKEGPSERRKFMDIGISQIKPRYFYCLQQYNIILNQRNALLKDINKNPALRKTLNIWNEQAVSAGAYITFQRNIFIEEILKVAKDIHRHISLGAEKLEIKYMPSIVAKDAELHTIQEKYYEILKNTEEEDIRKGNTGKGCHRDDFLPLLNGIDIRTFGSQGQQRTTVLSLKLSEIHTMYNETGEYPILLLDDCLSELDRHRQKMLFEVSKGIQTLITTSDLNGLPSSVLDNVEVHEVEQGRVI